METTKSIRCINPAIYSESLSPQFEKPQITTNTRKVVHIARSLSHLSISNAPSAHAEWLRKKKLEIRNKKRIILELKQKINDHQHQQQQPESKEEHERKQKENFRLWMKKKQQADFFKRKSIIKQQESEHHLQTIQKSTAIAGDVYFYHWCTLKNQIEKAEKMEIQRKLNERERERKEKIMESLKAFTEWQEESKNRPRPATQGLLPHQQATPAYINPVPWTVDNV